MSHSHEIFWKTKKYHLKKTAEVIICGNWIRKLVTFDRFLCGIFPESEFVGGQLLGCFAL